MNVTIMLYPIWPVLGKYILNVLYNFNTSISTKRGKNQLSAYRNYIMDCGLFGVRFLLLDIKMKLLLHR